MTVGGGGGGGGGGGEVYDGVANINLVTFDLKAA